MRTLLALIIIVSLLLCPYVCAVKEAVARSSAQGQSKTCCHHCRSETRSTDQEPASPTQRPDEDGQSCVCEGAIFSTIDRIAIEVTWLASSWICVFDPIVVQDFQNPLASIDQAGLPPPWRGLQRRIALRSLLI